MDMSLFAYLLREKYPLGENGNQRKYPQLQNEKQSLLKLDFGVSRCTDYRNWVNKMQVTWMHVLMVTCKFSRRLTEWDDLYPFTQFLFLAVLPSSWTLPLWCVMLAPVLWFPPRVSYLSLTTLTLSNAFPLTKWLELGTILYFCYRWLIHVPFN